VEVKVIVVKEGETQQPLASVGEELGEITVMSAADVEQAIQAGER
jgi:hypothetical protein